MEKSIVQLFLLPQISKEGKETQLLQLPYDEDQLLTYIDNQVKTTVQWIKLVCFIHFVHKQNS